MMKFILITTLLLLTCKLHARGWDTYNNPALITGGKKLQTRLASLPGSGQTNLDIWSGHYWPDKNGGIGARWLLAELGPGAINPHNYQTYGPRELAKLSQDQLDQLSPAEKFDIFMGRFDYPSVELERSRTSPHSPKWFGLCHSFAIASIYYNEPKEISYQLDYRAIGKKIKLRFFSSDIKALMALAINQSEDYQKKYFRFVGRRCESRTGDDPACWDVNPGALHVILGNMVGLKKESVVMDFGEQSDVWNHPVVSYQSTQQVIAKDKIEVETRVYRAVNVEPHKTPYGAKKRYKTYRYTLELNERGEITGGEWISKKRPDFIWTMRRPKFRGYFKDLKMLVEDK
jgi:hypothetical protein